MFCIDSNVDWIYMNSFGNSILGSNWMLCFFALREIHWKKSVRQRKRENGNPQQLKTFNIFVIRDHLLILWPGGGSSWGFELNQRAQHISNSQNLLFCVKIYKFKYCNERLYCKVLYLCTILTQYSYRT